MIGSEGERTLDPPQGGAEDRERRTDRVEREAARTRGALEDLAAVIVPVERAPEGHDLLEKALSAIGRSLGTEIRTPPGTRDVGGAGSVAAIARASRIRTRRVALRGEWWRHDSGPLLAFARSDGRPLALLPTRSRSYEVFDPAGGGRRRVGPEVAASLRNEAVMLYRSLPDGPVGLWDLALFSLRPRRRELTLALLTGLAATLLGMITPQATALLMDHAIPNADRRLVLEIGVGLLAATLGATIFQLSQAIVLLRLGLGSEAETQAAIWDRLLRLRPAFLRRFSSGDLQSRVTAVNDVGRQAGGVMLTTVFASTMALLNFFLLLYYSPRLTLVAAAVGAVVMTVTVSTGFVVRRLLRELMEIEGKFFGMVVQMIDAVGKLRVAGAAERAFRYWTRRYSEQLRLDAAIILWRDRLHVFNRILPALASAILFLVALDPLMADRATGSTGLSLGTFLAFTVAFSVFLSGVTSLSGTFVGLLDVQARGRRIQPILEEEPEVDESNADPGPLTGGLALEGVSFRYSEDGPRVLDDVSLHADPGELVAIVGPSGSGKSTILRLLLGFEQPEAGRVTCDGRDLSHLDVLAVRRQLGVVLQDGRLDAGSVFDNIACGVALSLEQAWAAAEDAGLAEEIRDMPMGMHTILSVGGGNVSGGQRQRLLIARALAHRPRIVLFDEATSALDNRTQSIVAESLGRLKVTRIVIAHRLSTIRAADRIHVVDGGRIVQVGSFDELLADGDGLFARMMHRQLATPPGGTRA